MKKLLLILLLIANTAKSQMYKVNRLEVQVKGSWDLKFSTQSVRRPTNLNVYMIMGMFSVSLDKKYRLDPVRYYTEYNDGRFIRTTWSALDDVDQPCRVIFEPNVIKVVYNDNGYYISTNYYINSFNNTLDILRQKLH
jgi:hypothetical protein